MSDRSSDNAAIHEANVRLLALREQARQARLNAGLPVGQPPPVVSSAASPADLLAQQPNHLGFGSETFARHLRLVQARQRQEESRRADATALKSAVARAEQTLPRATSGAAREAAMTPAVTVRIYPDLAVAMLREGQIAAGRLWHILRLIDQEGCGWLALDEVRTLLAEETSAQYLCSKRYLRDLFRQGEGMFWVTDDARVWYYGLERVAAALNVERLRLLPVMMSASVLWGPMGELRAHFFSTIHSSRTREQGSQRPISRATLEKISGVPLRTQRIYEERAGVTVQKNLAIGEAFSQAALQNKAWEKGGAVFKFVDKHGRQGRPGATYIAWQMPNSYIGPHKRCGRGRQRQLNRRIADLRNQGVAGNGFPDLMLRRYYGDGAAAAKAINRQRGEAYYWPSHQRGREGGRFWHFFSTA